MEIRCKSCGIIVGILAKGSKMRKNFAVLCQKCFDRMHTADIMAQQAIRDTPDFIKNLFPNSPK
jgi:hypothetical protein